MIDTKTKDSLSVLSNLSIAGLALDSREVKKGDLFFAYSGVSSDGRQFIDDAVQSGASAVLSEADDNNYSELNWRNKTPIISLKNLSEKISHIAARFYQYPSDDMTIIGVTGTNGKTSTSNLLVHTLNLLGEKAAVIGTLGCGTVGNLETICNLTTPDPILVQSLLNDYRNKKIKTVALESSSHALHQRRLDAVNFNLGIFTNLTRDHLDYHGDEKSYEAAKRLLFMMPSMQYGVFNLDDSIGVKWMNDFQEKLTICGYGLNHEIKFDDYSVVKAHDINLHGGGMSAMIKTPWGDGRLVSKLLGRFNLSNLLAVISSLCLLDYPLKDILKVMPMLHALAGRMQTVGGNGKPLVIIDFSHTPDALEQALKASREHCKGKLFCVFGCGGDRDRGKRPMMGKIAENFADRIILTNDNVRFEDPNKIIDDILFGILDKQRVQIEPDRKLAIKKAVDQAKSDDVILLAGKGHEPYQIIGNKVLPFCDEEVVKKIMGVTNNRIEA